MLKLNECKGENQEAAEVPFPDCDWEAVFYTSTKANSYTASCKGGEYVNCFKDEGGIHLVFNDHRMGVGTLKWEPHFELPNDIYPDSIQDLFSKQQLGIELVNGPGDCPTTAEVAVLLPYIKGEPFTYEDFTPEQIADLKRPATEAAERADKAVRAAEKATQEAVASNKQLAGNVAEAAGAETERVEAETARVTAETQRQSAEDTRKANEVERVKAEGLRDSNEATRESQEAERQSAETDRINAEKARVSAEASRVAAETKRASDFTEAEAQRQSTFESAEAERVQAEATRVSNENIRIGNEQSRVNAEHTRASQETARQDAENARQSNEQSRVTAEGARVEAENARAIEFAGFAATIAAKQDKITTSEDLSLSEENVLSLTEMAKKRLFIDLWNECAVDFGRYNEETGYFELNGITDLTWDDAKMIFVLSAYSEYPYYSNRGMYFNLKGKGSFRTNLPSICGGYTSHIRNQISTYLCDGIEVLNVMQRMPFNRPPYTTSTMRTNCQSIDLYWGVNLRKVMGIIYLNQGSAATYGYNLPELEEINLYNISKNYKYLYKAPKLNYTSVKTMIEERGGTDAITIWYHANVYNKILGTAEDAAYEGSGGTKEEWMALADLATSKNITLATE